MAEKEAKQKVSGAHHRVGVCLQGQVEEVQVEQSGVGGKEKERAVEQDDCVCYEKKGIVCMPPTEGNATACATC